MVPIFNTQYLLPYLLQSNVHKVIWCAIRPSIYSDVWHHIRGNDDDWADLIGGQSVRPDTRRLLPTTPPTYSTAEKFCLSTSE